MGYPTISISDIRRFKRCRRKWNYQSPHQRGLVSKEPQTALYLGSGVHKALEVYYNSEDDRDPTRVFTQWAEDEREKIVEELPEGTELWQDDLDELDEAVELGIEMIDHYKLWASKNDPDEIDEMMVVEQPFHVPLYTPKGNRAHCNLYGIIDGLFVDRFGDFWVHEIKTAAQLGQKNLDQDEQALAYMYAARELWGIDCAGMMFTVLRKKVPTIPRELKNGDITVRKNIATTYDVYFNKLIEYYGDEDSIPMDRYEEILEKLDQQENPFFERDKIRKTSYELDEFSNRLYHTYRDMMGNPALYPNPTRDCSWDCSFQDVCIQQSDGADYERTLDRLYKKRDYERKGVDQALTPDSADSITVA